MSKLEPFGYFRAEPFGWTDCAETDDGAVPLFDHAAIAALEHNYASLQQAFEEMKAIAWQRLAALQEAECQRDGLKADAVRYRWLPIKTAPRDGTEVILWFPHKNIAINGYYGETSDGDWESGYRTWMEWLVADELWFQEDPSQAPSHWMPLPNVPAIDIAITRGEE